MKNLLTFAVLAGLLGSCARQGDAPSFPIIDGAGRTVRIPRHVRRIVSLAPSVTEMIYALGSQDRLVGVTAWCNYPPGARSKAVVGDALSFNPEKLLALKPDLVIMAGTAHSPALARLEALGIPALVLDPASPDEVIAAIGMVGRALGDGDRADSLAAGLRQALRRLNDSAGLVPVPRRPSVFIEIGSSPLYTAGPSSFIGQLIEAAGGRNIAAGLPQDYAAISPEAVIARNPDIILILHPMAKKADVMKRIGWSTVNAARTGRVYDDIDLDIVLRPGPRVVQGLYQIRRITHESRP